MLGLDSASRPDFFASSGRLPLAGTRITPEKCGWRPAEDSADYSQPEPTRPHGFGGLLAEPCDLDARATAIASQAGKLRLTHARLAAEFLRRRLWRPLGASRLPDYLAERQGVAARTFQDDARVATELATLPILERAVESEVVSWTHARLLAGIATAQTEQGWLQVALSSTTRRLAELTKAARRGDHAPGHEPRPNACATSDDRVASHDTAASTSGPDACASSDDTAASTPGPDACASNERGAGSATETIAEPDDRPVRWTISTTRIGRKLYRATCELASRIMGVDVGPAQVLEAVAAEASSWPFCDPPSPEPPPDSRSRRATGTFSAAFEARYGTSEGFRWLPPRQTAAAPQLAGVLDNLSDAPPDEMDARLRRVRAAMQRVDSQLGAVLRAMADSKAHQRLGYATIRLYAEARLGVCGSKAMDLIKLDRECQYRSPLLLEEYRDGRIGWLAALELLRIINLRYEKEWLERAESVTLRRLRGDVSWALDRADDDGARPHQPPAPIGLDVTADALARVDEEEVRMRAQETSDPDSFSRQVDAPITVIIPASVAALLDDVIEGCRRTVEPPWRGFERILAHAYLTWTSLPQHESPIFARDNFRCQVPGCSRRGPLHRHHVWFRSHGGPDWGWNLVCVCDEHHHDFIHLGRIHVEGCAPDGLVWELGCLPGKLPLMRLRGEVYLYK